MLKKSQMTAINDNPKFKGFVFSLEEIDKAARYFIDSMGDDRIFLFNGEMGAGKTTFIAEVCRQLGAVDDFGSPTFSLVNEYEDKEGNPIYHFDLYRLQHPGEVFDIGGFEIFESGAICFVEWPDKLGEMLPEKSRVVNISVNSDDTRCLTYENSGYPEK